MRFSLRGVERVGYSHELYGCSVFVSMVTGSHEKLLLIRLFISEINAPFIFWRRELAFSEMPFRQWETTKHRLFPALLSFWERC